MNSYQLIKEQWNKTPKPELLKDSVSVLLCVAVTFMLAILLAGFS